MFDRNHNAEGTPDTAAGPRHRRQATSSFTVRFWDYSQKPSNRTAPKPLKTLDRKISNRKKFRSSIFGFLSLFLDDVTSLLADSRLLAVANRHSESITLTTLGDGHTPWLMGTPCFVAPLPLSNATLGDGHAVPSENAVTQAASTKARKLMDTLFGGFERRFS